MHMNECIHVWMHAYIHQSNYGPIFSPYPTDRNCSKTVTVHRWTEDTGQCFMLNKEQMFRMSFRQQLHCMCEHHQSSDLDRTSLQLEGLLTDLELLWKSIPEILNHLWAGEVTFCYSGWHNNQYHFLPLIGVISVHAKELVLVFKQCITPVLEALFLLEIYNHSKLPNFWVS